MRIALLITLICTGLLPSPSSAQDTTTAVSSTKMDSSVKSILEVILGSLIKKIPGITTNSSLSVSPDSTIPNMSGDLSLEWSNSTDENPNGVLLKTQGQWSLQILNSNNSNYSLLQKTQLTPSQSEFLKTLTTIHSSFLTSPLPENLILALPQFKLDWIAHIDTLTNKGSQPTKRLFGVRTAETDQKPFSAEQGQTLKSAIEKGMILQLEENTNPVVTFDGSLFKAFASINAQKNNLSYLEFLQSVTLEINSTDVLVTVTATIPVKSQVINTYDAYLTQQQNSDKGLTSLAELIEKLGPWAVGRCSKENYRALCIDKLLFDCTRDTERVAACVDEATSIQAAREARNNGDTLGVISNGFSIFTNQTGQAIEDLFSGDDSTSQEGE